jgi:hypothetical protein
MSNEQLGMRVLNFYNFIYSQGWEGGICWHQNAFHVTITCDGNIYSYGEEPTLTAALDSCIEGLRNGGF